MLALEIAKFPCEVVGEKKCCGVVNVGLKLRERELLRELHERTLIYVVFVKAEICPPDKVQKAVAISRLLCKYGRETRLSQTEPRGGGGLNFHFLADVGGQPIGCVTQSQLAGLAYLQRFSSGSSVAPVSRNRLWYGPVPAMSRSLFCAVILCGAVVRFSSERRFHYYPAKRHAIDTKQGNTR